MNEHCEALLHRYIVIVISFTAHVNWLDNRDEFNLPGKLIISTTFSLSAPAKLGFSQSFLSFHRQYIKSLCNFKGWYEKDYKHFSSTICYLYNFIVYYRSLAFRHTLVFSSNQTFKLRSLRWILKLWYFKNIFPIIPAWSKHFHKVCKSTPRTMNMKHKSKALLEVTFRLSISSYIFFSMQKEKLNNKF